MQRPTVSALEARLVVEDLLGAGLSAQEIARASRLRASELTDADARVPATGYLAALALGAARTGDPLFALKLGARCRPEQGGLVLHLAASCRTYLESFQVAIRYAGLVNELTRVELRLGRSRAIFAVAVPDPRYRSAAPVELALGRALSTMRELWKDDFRLHTVRLRGRAPTHAAAYRAFFGAPVRFGQAESALEFDRALLDRAQAHHSPYLRELLQRRADELLAGLTAGEDLVARVQRLLLERLAHGAADVSGVARALGMSRQTLYRRLQAHGTSFQDTLERTRRTVALEQLRRGELSVTEIAFLLGYSEPAAFQRAFRRWTGTAPGRYRRGK